MKAASFDYIRVKTLDEACKALSEFGEEARIIAGGQTLIPLMAMRLARPSKLIDINEVEELAGITIENERLVIKAKTRQAEALSSNIVNEKLPLLAEALSHVGHTQTRNLGTIGGSLVNADPAAEIPLIAQPLEAIIAVKSVRGTRNIPANEFFESAMATSLAPDECLVEVRFPIWTGEKIGFGFHEVSIRDSDYALAAAAAQILLDDSDNCKQISIAICGASPTPVRLRPQEELMLGKSLSDELINVTCNDFHNLIEPQSDVHADANYRSRVAKVMATRAICDARDRAKGILR